MLMKVERKPCICSVSLQSTTTVHVSNSNAPAAVPLVVGGYDVSGEVRSDGDPMKEVTFLLFSATVNQEVSLLTDQGGQEFLHLTINGCISSVLGISLMICSSYEKTSVGVYSTCEWVPVTVL